MAVDFSLSPEELLIQKTAREFVEREVMPLEPEVMANERAGRPAIAREKLRALQEKARDIGFWGLTTPEELGGAHLGALVAAVLETELGRTIVPFVFGGTADNILYYANAEQRERYLAPTIAGDRVSCFALTEPGAGSDAGAIRMSAVRDGDEFILNGEKIFITNGSEADFAMVFAVTDPARGSRGGVTCFLVDRDMGWRSTPIPTMGEREPAALVFDNVRVPAANVLGEVGGGFTIGLEWIGRARWVIPARAVGAAERLLAMAVDHARQRSTFGRPLADREAIQWMLADSAVEIEATRWMAYRAAWLDQAGRDNRHQAAMAKLYGANMANRVADRVMQVHGGMGYTKALPIEWWYREMRVWRIFDGTDEMQRFIIARNLLKGHVPVVAALD